MLFSFETGLVMLFMAFIHIVIYFWYRIKTWRSIRGRHVLVTDGLSGIGLWVAINCVKLGAHVTIIAQNPQSEPESDLEKLKKYRTDAKQLIQFRSIDLSKSYDVVKNALSALEEEIAPIYMLINCAGGAICGRVDEVSPEDAVYLMNINYYAVYYPTRYVLTQLKKTGEGIITITGSQASLMGVYGYGPYTATKFALRGLAETIAMEVSNTKISVTFAFVPDADKDDHAYSVETKGVSTTTAELEKISEKIVHDSLSHKSISSTNLELWMLTFVWKTVCSVRLLLHKIFDKNNNVRGSYLRSGDDKNRATSENLAVSKPNDETPLLENVDKPENNTLSDTVSSDLNVNVTKLMPQSDEPAINNITVAMSKQIESNVSNIEPSADSTSGVFPIDMIAQGFPSSTSLDVESSKMHGALDATQKSIFSFNPLKSSDGAIAETKVFAFNAQAPSKTDQPKAAQFTFNFSNLTTKSVDLQTNTTFSSGSASLASSFPLTTPNSASEKSDAVLPEKSSSLTFSNPAVNSSSALAGQFGTSETTVNSTIQNASDSNADIKEGLTEFEKICAKFTAKSENNNSTKVTSANDFDLSTKIATGAPFTFSSEDKSEDASTPFNFEAPAANNIFGGISSTDTTNQLTQNQRRPTRIAIRRK